MLPICPLGTVSLAAMLIAPMAAPDEMSPPPGPASESTVVDSASASEPAASRSEPAVDSASAYEPAVVDSASASESAASRSESTVVDSASASEPAHAELASPEIPPVPPPVMVRDASAMRRGLDHDELARIGRLTTASGVVSFGVAYLGSIGSGIVALRMRVDPGDVPTDENARLTRYGRRMLIPVAGPFLALPDADGRGARTMTVLAGTVQGLGLAAVITGVALWVRGTRGAAEAHARWSLDPGGVRLRF